MRLRAREIAAEGRYGVRRHKRIESYIGIEHVFVSWPVWSARSIQSTF